VLVTMTAAVTLIPALLGMIGMRALSRRERRKLAERGPSDPKLDGFWPRWAQFVQDHRIPLAAAALVVMLALAIPALALRLGSSDAGQDPASSTTRKAYDLLAKGFGAGFNGPIPVVVVQNSDSQAAQKVYDAAKTLPKAQVAFVQAPILNDKKDVGLVMISPATAPQAAATDTLINRLRNATVPGALNGSTAKAYVSGQNAAFIDIGDRIYSRAPWFLLYIIGVTFIVLAMAFRSVVIAIKAAITTLISAIVGFGVLTWVMKMGNGLSLIGLDRTGPIESFVPPIAFAILFGLSMDYEVFLMSRIREEHIHGKATIPAVRSGVAAIGRVVFAAAIIMSSVFFAFLLTPDRVSKEFGLLLAVSILVDALIMRLTVVPALLALLGERSWAMPVWLDRILPKLTIEPPTEQPSVTPGLEERPVPVT